MVKYSLFLLACVFCSSFSATAQLSGQAKIDSLLAVLKTSKEDTSKVNTLVALSQNFATINTTEGFKYGEQALALAKKLNWKKGIAWATMRIGFNHVYKKEDSTGIVFYKQAIPLFKEVADKAGLAKTLSNTAAAYADLYNHNEALKYLLEAATPAKEAQLPGLEQYLLVETGKTYTSLGNYPKALEYLLKALKNAEKDNNKAEMLKVVVPIGYVHFSQADWPETIKAFNKALALAEELKDSTQIAYCLHGIGNANMNAGDPKTAKTYMLRSIQVSEQSGNRSILAVAYQNLSPLYCGDGDFITGMDYIMKALQINKEFKNKWNIALNYDFIAQILLHSATDNKLPGQRFIEGNKKDLLNQAKRYADSAIAVNKETGDPKLLSDSYQSLTYILREQGDYKAALESFETSINLRDSVFNTDKNKKLAQLSMEYEQEKKDAQAKADQEKKEAIQRNIRNAILIGLGVSLLFLFWIFRQRNKISKEKKRSDELLLNILPAEVAEELKSKGSADARQFDTVTVMFTDFKGFTGVAEKLSPQELVSEINGLFSAFDEIITRYGIEKIKTIGDSYMCAGGLPVANITHAGDVVMAGKEIQAFMAKHATERMAANKPLLEIRIGIHTGPVVAGIVGIKKFAYDIWGDTVNIASRMESSGEPGKVNISGASYELVKDKFHCSYRGKIQAKNKGEIDMYFVEEAISPVL